MSGTSDPTEAELRASFDEFDTDKSGAIDDDEFARLLSVLGVRMSAEEVHTAFLAIDVNGNRRIDFGEFKNWWNRRAAGR